MKKQKELFPKLNTIMFGQLKVFAFVIVIFFAFTWLVNALDPNLQDDVLFPLADDGSGCDEKAADGLYSGCYLLASNPKPGAWVAHITVSNNGNVLAENRSVFFVTAKDGTIGDREVYIRNSNTILPLSTSKSVYAPGERIILKANPASSSILTGKLDNGTHFYFDLPFTIPVLNIRRLSEPSEFFILVSIFSSFLVSFVLEKFYKKGGIKNG